MLFNSYTFLFVFLPTSLLIFHGLRRIGLERASILALVLSSFVFYGYWNPVYLLLLIALILFNYIIASEIIARRLHQPHVTRAILITGIVINLGVLGYFKYANFFVDNLNSIFAANIAIATIILPLGISFFGKAWTEDKLIGMAYAFEQLTKVRKPPAYRERVTQR